MIIATSRFGQLEVDDRRLIEFQGGMLGFPEHRRYGLIQTGQNSGFYWLQAVLAWSRRGVATAHPEAEIRMTFEGKRVRTRSKSCTIKSVTTSNEVSRPGIKLKRCEAIKRGLPTFTNRESPRYRKRSKNPI